MIIDGHIHLTKEQNPIFKTPPYRAEQLVKHMEGPYTIAGRTRRVDKALVQGHPADTIYKDDIREHQAYVAEAIKKYPDRLMGCMIVNPLFGLDRNIKEIRHFVQEEGFKALKLHPTIHGYLPHKNVDILVPILEEAGKLNVPVIIHTGDPPFSLPVLMVPLIEACPKTKVILAHLGTQQITYAHEAVYVAQRNNNVYLETGWSTLPRLKEAVITLGPERFVFASDCPIQEMWSQLRVIEVLTWEPPIGINLPLKDMERIMGDNMAGLLGIAL